MGLENKMDGRRRETIEIPERHSKDLGFEIMGSHIGFWSFQKHLVLALCYLVRKDFSLAHG